MANEWIFYTNVHHALTLKRADEPAPQYGRKSQRIPTPEEIGEELKRRKERQLRDERLREWQRLEKEFVARQDYRDAVAVAFVMEGMTHEKHPLDRLTPAEWAALRQKLGA